MFDNLICDPINVTDEEIQYLEERRKQEKAVILDKDTFQEGLEHNKMWFIISSEWLYHWKCFVSNRLSTRTHHYSTSYVRQSQNSLIGILPPGPIFNEDLFEKGRESKIKQGLELNVHYRGVNQEVWQIFHKMYGGGPVILREELDIYSRDPSSDFPRSNKRRLSSSDEVKMQSLE